MPNVLWEKLSKDTIIGILNISTSMSDLIRKIGYHSPNGQSRKQIYNVKNIGV